MQSTALQNRLRQITAVQAQQSMQGTGRSHMQVHGSALVGGYRRNLSHGSALVGGYRHHTSHGSALVGGALVGGSHHYHHGSALCGGRHPRMHPSMMHGGKANSYSDYVSAHYQEVKAEVLKDDKTKNWAPKFINNETIRRLAENWRTSGKTAHSAEKTKRAVEHLTSKAPLRITGNENLLSDFIIKHFKTALDLVGKEGLSGNAQQIKALENLLAAFHQFNQSGELPRYLPEHFTSFPIEQAVEEHIPVHVVEQGVQHYYPGEVSEMYQEPTIYDDEYYGEYDELPFAEGAGRKKRGPGRPKGSKSAPKKSMPKKHQRGPKEVIYQYY